MNNDPEREFETEPETEKQGTPLIYDPYYRDPYNPDPYQ